MRRGTVLVVTLALMAGVVLSVLPARAEGDESELKKKLDALKALDAEEFSRENNAGDLVRGFVTGSVAEGDGYVAYVYLHWGDLDDKIDTIDPEHYSNWDGYVEVSGGMASVEAEIVFDDGSAGVGSEPPPSKEEILARFVDRMEDRIARITARIEEKVDDPDRREELIAKAEARGEKAIADFTERLEARPEPGPREGSGRDLLLPSDDESVVSWEAGVIGATDGLLIKLELDSPEATGEIQAGVFTIPFMVAPVETEE